MSLKTFIVAAVVSDLGNIFKTPGDKTGRYAFHPRHHIFGIGKKMKTNRIKVVLITGASSGFGRATALFLSREGHKVYGTSRKPEKGTPPCEMIRMDVNDDDSVKKGIRHIIDKEGRLDGVVNNAGFGIAGSTEDTDTAEMKHQFETNFFGVFRVLNEVIPVMREQGSGYIVTIGSIAGCIGIPFQGAYSASKFALEGLIESLRMEVKPFGIHAVLIEPGDFKTDFTDNRIKTKNAHINPAYQERFKRALNVMEDDEVAGAAPEKIAVLINRIIHHPSPKPRYMIGTFMEQLAVHLKKCLPQRLFEWLIMKTYKV